MSIVPGLPTAHTWSTPTSAFVMLVAVHGQVQNYDWGKLGASSSVARLWSSATGGAIVDNKPYAELWLGTHPSGPARLAADATLLRDHLGAELPFLLKNLSVNKALSIQAHPNKTLAAQLHASAPQHYKDDNHKPEMTLALGDFQCMCGFRPIADIASCLQSVPELRELVGERISSTFEQLVAAGASAESTEVKKALHDVFEAVMKCTEVDRYLQPLLNRIRQTPLASSILQSATSTDIDLTELLLRLSEQYPSDIGCFAPFLLNTFTLRVGEAIFLGPNLPHAYLYGDCIEAMACSDNVVRAGLTPKFRDVDVLCEMLTYQTGPPPIMTGTPIDAFSTLYGPPSDSDVDEFEVTRTLLPASTEYTLPEVRGSAILLVCAGAGSASSCSADKLSLGVGSTVLVPSGSPVQFHTSESELLVFRCSERQCKKQ